MVAFLCTNFVCLDVDECADGTDNCHVNADCTDTIGSFQCTCSIGYSGDGVVSCNGEDRCHSPRDYFRHCHL